jgi:hypothetical protein
MWVATWASASGRAISGMMPSPSSSTWSAAAPRSRRRVSVIVRAPASSEFCTSSASAFRGSVCERASQRISSNGSAGRRRPVRISGSTRLREERTGRPLARRLRSGQAIGDCGDHPFSPQLAGTRRSTAPTSRHTVDTPRRAPRVRDRRQERAHRRFPTTPPTPTCGTSRSPPQGTRDPVASTAIAGRGAACPASAATSAK